MVSANATSILSTLITANHILHYHSVLDAYGHISVRNPENASTFFFARTLAPALISSAEDINELNVADASQRDPTRPRSFVERFIHSEIYKRFEDVNSVVHSFLGDQGVPNFDIAKFYEADDQQDLLVSNTRLGAALANTFDVNSTTNSFPDPPAVLMRGHGLAVAGETIEQAVFFSISTQSNAAIQSSAIELEHAYPNTGEGSGLRYLTAQEGRDAWSTNKPLIVRPWELWQREVQTMGQGLYVNRLEQ